MLRVHPKHIYRLLRRGLPARRVGGHWRFSSTEIERWARGDTLGEEAGTESNQKLQKGTEDRDPSALILSRDDLADRKGPE